MSYTPNVWANGDVVTSEKLNAMEQGIADASGGGGGVLVVEATETGDYLTLGTKAGTIYNAFCNGTNVVVTMSFEGYGVVEAESMVGVMIDEQTFQKVFLVNTANEGLIPGKFTAATDNDYPTNQTI